MPSSPGRPESTASGVSASVSSTLPVNSSSPTGKDGPASSSSSNPVTNSSLSSSLHSPRSPTTHHSLHHPELPPVTSSPTVAATPPSSSAAAMTSPSLPAADPSQASQLNLLLYQHMLQQNRTPYVNGRNLFIFAIKYQY